MALAPKTVLTYPLNGTNRDFVIPFEYLARKFVQVTLIGQDRKLLTLNIDYRFTLRTIITLTKNWGPADGYERIEIRRYTSATERLVDFSDGSILRAYDLNTSQVQSLHIAEEGRDVASDTIGVNNDGDLDARGRRIVNLADAVNDGDAVTLRQQKSWANTALNHRDAAAASASASQTSRLASEVAAANSLTSAGNSLASANLAELWATSPYNAVVASGKYSAFHWAEQARLNTTDSKSWATAAAESAAASAASAVTATTQAGLATSNGAAQVSLATAQAGKATASATDAARSRDLSKLWASHTENSVVTDGLYSSYHYSRQSAASADRAASWAASLNLPALTGNGGRVLVAKPDASGYEFKHRPNSYAFQCFYARDRPVGVNAMDLLTGASWSLNNGNCYSSATGRFTAEVSGLYRFHLSVTRGVPSNGRQGSPIVGIMHNGVSLVYATSYGADYSSAAVELIVQLEVGDYVNGYFKNGNGSDVALAAWAFSGHIL